MAKIMFYLYVTQVTQQSMWGRDNIDESGSQKGMNFASVVTATGSPSSSVGSANTHATFLDTEPPIQVRYCVELRVCTRVVSKVSFPVFFLGVLWDQCKIAGRHNFLSFWKHCKNYVAIASQKCTECSIENGASIACSCALRGVRSYSFFFHPKQIICWNSTGKCVRHTVTVCLYNCYGNGMNTLSYEF